MRWVGPSGDEPYSFGCIKSARSGLYHIDISIKSIGGGILQGKACLKRLWRFRMHWVTRADLTHAVVLDNHCSDRIKAKVLLLQDRRMSTYVGVPGKSPRTTIACSGEAGLPRRRPGAFLAL